jgi:hypothetical protein
MFKLIFFIFITTFSYSFSQENISEVSDQISSEAAKSINTAIYYANILIPFAIIYIMRGWISRKIDYYRLILSKSKISNTDTPIYRDGYWWTISTVNGSEVLLCRDSEEGEFGLVHSRKIFCRIPTDDYINSVIIYAGKVQPDKRRDFNRQKQ